MKNRHEIGINNGRAHSCGECAVIGKSGIKCGSIVTNGVKFHRNEDLYGMKIHGCTEKFRERVTSPEWGISRREHGNQLLRKVKQGTSHLSV